MISHILCLCTRYGGGAVGGVLRCLTYSYCPSTRYGGGAVGGGGVL